MSAEWLVSMAVLGVTVLAVFVAYRWRQKKRAGQVEKWVKEYLCVRYGKLPNPLNINCSNDPLWPVLVVFDTPGTGIRRRLQFTGAESHSTFALVSEKEDKR